MKVLSIGEIIWDVYPDKRCIGGAPFNFAAHSALLGEESYLLSAVGDDELAAPALEEVKRFKINPQFIKTLRGKQTGQCKVSLNQKGVPDYNVLTDVAYDYLEANDELLGFDAVAFGTLFQRSEQNKKLINEILSRYSFSHIFCDLNLRKPFYSKESALLCAQNATILKISREELSTATQLLLEREIAAPATAARALSAAFPNLKIILITLDCDGAFAFQTEEKRSYFVPAKSIKVVSTVGAGDSFGAAFLSSYAKNGDINEALERAVSLSSFVVSRVEAVPEKR